MRASTGGMQTMGLQHSLYCPKCGKPAALKEGGWNYDFYLHFTKKGHVWHDVQHDRQPTPEPDEED